VYTVVANKGPMLTYCIPCSHSSFITSWLHRIFTLYAGAQQALHFGGGNFHWLSFNDVSVLIQS